MDQQGIIFDPFGNIFNVENIIFEGLNDGVVIAHNQILNTGSIGANLDYTYPTLDLADTISVDEITTLAIRCNSSTGNIGELLLKDISNNLVWAPPPPATSIANPLSQNLNLSVGYKYQINGTDVLTSSALGSSIVSILGTLTSNLNVAADILPSTMNTRSIGSAGLLFNHGYFTNITGTIQTAAQTNITSLGTLTSNLILASDILPSTSNTRSIGSGALLFNHGYFTNITGTIQTAAQTNITSLGTLSSNLILASNILPSTSNVRTIGSAVLLFNHGYFTNITGTIQTAAQTNISSLGTLTSNLNVAANILPSTTNTRTIGSSGLLFNHGYFTNITGTLQTTAQTNISSLGTLTSNLNVAANILPSTSNTRIIGSSGLLFNHGYFTNITGTIQTAAQTNITSLGTLSSNLNVAADILPSTTNTRSIGSGALLFNHGYFTNITGTIQTAAQTNITSLGTLTSNLNVAANILSNTDNAYNIGSTSSRFANGYFTALNGNVSGANLPLLLNQTSATNVILTHGISTNTTNTINLNGSNISLQKLAFLSAGTEVGSVAYQHNATAANATMSINSTGITAMSGTYLRLNNTKGARLLNQTDAQQAAITSPDSGAILYNSNKQTTVIYNGTAWQPVKLWNNYTFLGGSGSVFNTTSTGVIVQNFSFTARSTIAKITVSISQVYKNNASWYTAWGVHTSQIDTILSSWTYPLGTIEATTNSAFITQHGRFSCIAEGLTVGTTYNWSFQHGSQNAACTSTIYSGGAVGVPSRGFIEVDFMQ